MVFVTYVSPVIFCARSVAHGVPDQYDLRAAERARDRLQGSEISGRPVSKPTIAPNEIFTQNIDRRALLLATR